MNRLKRLRQDARLTIRELSEKTGFSIAVLSRLENEKRPFTQQHLEILSQFFDCSFDYILGKSDERKPKEQKVKFPELDSLSIALLAHTKDLSDAEKQQVVDFIDFIKSKKKEG